MSRGLARIFHALICHDFQITPNIIGQHHDEEKAWQKVVSCVLVILVYRITLKTDILQKTITSSYQGFCDTCKCATSALLI